MNKRRKGDDPPAGVPELPAGLAGGFANLLSHFPAMVYRCLNDESWTMEEVSDGCLAVTGYTRRDLLKNSKVSFGNLVHPEDAERLWEKCQACLDQRQQCNNEYRIIAADGKEKWVWDRAHGVHDASGALLAIEGFIVDITERKQYEDRLEYLARFDGLTDLPNRGLFEDRLQQALARAQRTGERIAVHYLDLDYFKSVNDTYGHGVGDELLKAISVRLAAQVRETDTVARLGGDEFAILQVGVSGAAGAKPRREPPF